MTSPQAQRNPYPGPRPFEADERTFFFGREQEVRNLFSFIAAHRIVLLYAQSGAGKTSLIQAGLLPRLVENSFQVLSVRIGGYVPKSVDIKSARNVYIFTILMSLEQERAKAEELRKYTLAKFLKTLPRPDQRGGRAPQVLIIDQFEEIFTSYSEYWEQREDFFRQIADALDSDPLLRVVFVVREDFVAQLDPFTSILPSRLRTRFRLERLSEEAAIAAITGPLKGTGRSFQRGVAEQLVTELLKEKIQTHEGKVLWIRGQYVEPVQLQVVCHGLWSPDVKVITKDHLREFGDIDRSLSRFYDGAILNTARATHVPVSQLRRFCEEQLITPMGTRSTVFRNKQSLGGISVEAVDELERQHLVRSEWRSGARWYELTHDRFIEPIRQSNKEFQKTSGELKRSLFLANSQRDLELDDQARETLQKVLKDAVQIGDLWAEGASSVSLAEICLSKQEYEEATRLATKAVEIFLGSEAQDLYRSSLLQLAYALRGLEQYVKQAEVLTSLLRADPNFRAKRLYQRGVAYWYAGMYEEAIADLTEAITERGQAFELLMARGQVYAEKGFGGKAVRDLEKALKLADSATGIAYTRNGLGLAYARLRKFDKALAEFAASMKAAPENAWLYFNRAQCYEAMGRINDAVAEYRTSLEKKDPILNPHKREKANEFLRSHAQPQ